RTVRVAEPGTALLLEQGRPTQDGEPHQADHAGYEDDAADELAHGPATADPRDEHAHERRPRDPPGPVEDGPAAQPAFHPLAVGGRARHHQPEVAEVGAER